MPFLVYFIEKYFKLHFLANSINFIRKKVAWDLETSSLSRIQFSLVT